jgi:thiamine biosynthesis lipoprotein
VRFRKKGIKIDLGGIAKGYAIDKAVNAMKDSGVQGGIVDVGGDIRCFGKLPENRKYWQVAIQDPQPSKEYDTFMTLKIKSGAVATSGDYRRFYEQAGQKFSHIIDPNENWSSNGPSSVTVIAETALQADVFATAVSVMGTKKGLEFINRTDNVEAIIIEIIPDGKYRISKSTKAQGYIK